MLNFNKDFFYPGTTRGLFVELYGGYQLSSADRMWIHPAMNRTTTIFSTGCDSDEISAQMDRIKKLIKNGWYVEGDTNKGSGDQSVGLYVFRTTDEYAVTHEDYRLVIEHIPSMELPALSGKLSDWVREYELQASDNDTLEKVTSMAMKLFPKASMISHKQTNAFFKRETSYVYLNYAWKLNANEKHAYLKFHPSLGFCKYEVEPHTIPIVCPATIGYEGEVTPWSEMDPRRLLHINNTLSWTDEQVPFHRHIQRSTVTKNAAVDAYIAAVGLTRGEHMYTKCVICGSSNAAYTPDEVMALTKQDVVPFSVKSLVPFIDKNHHKVPRLFNPRLISEDGLTLHLPPDMLRDLCKL